MRAAIVVLSVLALLVLPALASAHTVPSGDAKRAAVRDAKRWAERLGGGKASVVACRRADAHRWICRQKVRRLPLGTGTCRAKVEVRFRGRGSRGLTVRRLRSSIRCDRPGAEEPPAETPSPGTTPDEQPSDTGDQAPPALLSGERPTVPHDPNAAPRDSIVILG